LTKRASQAHPKGLRRKALRGLAEVRGALGEGASSVRKGAQEPKRKDGPRGLVQFYRKGRGTRRGRQGEHRVKRVEKKTTAGDFG